MADGGKRPNGNKMSNGNKSLSERVIRLETRMDNVATKEDLQIMANSMADSLRTEINSLRTEMYSIMDKMNARSDERQRWLIGTMIAVGLLIVAMLEILQ